MSPVDSPDKDSFSFDTLRGFQNGMREIVIKERFTPFPVLTTPRLVLRQLQLTDTEEMFRLRTEREVNRYIPRAPLLHREEAFDFILKINEGIQANKWVYWGIRSIDKSKLMGTICLWNFTADGRHADVGYEMLPEFCHHGFMTEALKRVIEYASRELSMTRLEAHTFSNNTRSVRLLTNNGFRLIVEPEENLKYNEVLYFRDLKS